MACCAILGTDENLESKLKSLPEPQIVFNFLGQFDQTLPEASPFAFASESTGQSFSPKNARGHLLAINSRVIDGCLKLDWTYSENSHRHSTIEQLARDFIASLRTLIRHCVSPESGGFTPSDFKEADLDQSELDQLISELNESNN